MYNIISYDTYLYYSLSLFAGIIAKIYDDLYDNDLYETFGIKNKIFITEILKCLVSICIVILSLKNIYFFIWLALVNIVSYFMKPDEYGDYEIALLISMPILIPFLNYDILLKNINNVCLILLVYIIGYIFWEGKSGVIEDEYSLKKLIQRSTSTIFLIILLFFNFYTEYLSIDINYVIICIIGYLFTSSLFQAFLLYKNSKDALTLSTENLLIQENTLLKYFCSLPIFSYFLDLNPLI